MGKKIGIGCLVVALVVIVGGRLFRVFFICETAYEQCFRA